jgi:protein-S-isoprenylcysteine O-methyltransferase Ste14
LKESSNTPLAVFLLSVFVLLLFYHPTFNENDKWQKLNSYANYLIAYAFPICLWGYLLVRRAIRGRAST